MVLDNKVEIKNYSSFLLKKVKQFGFAKSCNKNKHLTALKKFLIKFKKSSLFELVKKVKN